MNTVAAVIDSLNAKIAQLQGDLATARKRAQDAETAWAAALDRARTAEEELAWLKKELSEEAD